MNCFASNCGRGITAAAAATLVLLLVGCQKQSQAKVSGRAAANPADSAVVELVGIDSVTAYDLLSRVHTVRAKATAMGVFVQAIDSLANSDAAAWIYSVNDTMPKIASNYLFTRCGDRVTWHFRKMRK